MRAALLLAMFFVAAPDRPAPDPRANEVAPQDLILGDWQLEKIASSGGLGAPPMDGKEVRTLQFTRTEILVKVNGQPKSHDSIGYTVDWTKKPTAIDILPRNGPMKKLEGILRLEGDQLTICFCIDGGRPTDFNTDSGKLTALMHLKRVKR